MRLDGILDVTSEHLQAWPESGQRVDSVVSRVSLSWKLGPEYLAVFRTYGVQVRRTIL